MIRPAVPAKPAARGPLSLKITLRNIKPPIWRRILVPRGMTLGDLHVAIQVVMGCRTVTCTPSRSPASNTANAAAWRISPMRTG